MAISVVQTATGTGNPPFSFGSAVTVGNTVILVVPGYSTTGSSPSTGSVKLGGNTITGTVAFFNPGTTAGVASANDGGNVAYVSIWMLPNVQVSGQTAVDVTFTAGNSGIGGVAYEVSGLGTSPSLDQSTSSSGITSTAVDSGTTSAITAAPEIIIGGAMIFSGAGAGSPAGFTVSNPTGDCWAGYQVATSSGGTYNWHQAAGGGNPWTAALVTIQGTAAAPTPSQVVLSAPYQPPPPPLLVPAQVVTGPLPPPPAQLAQVTQSEDTPYQLPTQLPPQSFTASTPTNATVQGITAILNLSAPAGHTTPGRVVPDSGGVTGDDRRLGKKRWLFDF